VIFHPSPCGFPDRWGASLPNQPWRKTRGNVKVAIANDVFAKLTIGRMKYLYRGRRRRISVCRDSPCDHYLRCDRLRERPDRHRDHQGISSVWSRWVQRIWVREIR